MWKCPKCGRKFARESHPHPYGQVDVDLIARIAAWRLGGTESR
jgi:ribosomal protein L37AE/L43A